MKHNVGSADRLIRIIAGIAIIAFAVFAHGPIRWTGLVGSVLLTTGFVSFCPAYWLLRIKTLSTPVHTVGD
jgi:hypothetical protein